MKKSTPIVLLTAALSFPSLAETVTFKYSEPHKIQKSDAEVGEPILVVVTGACEEFDIKYQGFESVPPVEDGRTKSGGGGRRSSCADSVFNAFCAGGKSKSTQETIEHMGRYGGYEIRVVPPEGVTRMVTHTKDEDFDMEKFCWDTGIPQLKSRHRQASEAYNDNKTDGNKNALNAALNELVARRAKLLSTLGRYDGTDFEITQVQNREYLVVVENSRWQTDFSVGPVVSGLTSPLYYVDDTNTIRRNRSAEDDVELILAGFAHVWFGESPLALTGGVGTSSTSTIDYFMGLSRRFGPAMLTGGAHWGSVRRLPAGYAVNEITDDVSVVTDSRMEERTDMAFFLSLTYTFGDGADKGTFGKNIARIGN